MLNSFDSSEPPQQKKTKCCKLPLDSHYVVFYVCVTLLLTATVLSCSLLGISAASHQVYSSRYRDTKTMQLVSATALAAGEESVALSLGKSCSSVCGTLDSKLNELQKAVTKKEFEMGTVRSYVQQGRKAYADVGGPSLEAMSAYNRATFVLSEGLRVMLGKQTDTSSATQVGLLCVLQPLIPLFHHFTLQYPQLLVGWNLFNYQQYMGSLKNDVTFPSCGAFLNGVPTVKIEDIIAFGPKVVNLPVITTDKVSEMDDATFQHTSDGLTELVTTYNTQAKAHWKKQMEKLSIVIALSTVSIVIILVSLCFASHFITAKTSRNDAAIHAQYQKVDSRAKLIPQFARYVSTLKGEEHLHTFLQGSILSKIEGFVNRVRPLIPQTCFGDVEVAGFTDSGEVVQPRDEPGFNAASGISASGGPEDEHRVQELRGEVGLQVAFGTFMCVAATAHLRPDKGVTGQEQQRMLTERMGRLVAAVEELANARRGAVHSIAGDYIIVTWNIVSPCHSSEVNAFLSALELANRFRDSHGGISISLSSSPTIAGNFDANGQRTSVLLGPGQPRCEKLELLNDYLGTDIAMDAVVARTISSATLPVQSICVLPAAVYRCATDMEKGPFEVAYAVYPTALKERHKAWVSMFRDFPSALLAGKLDELIDQVTAFKRAYLNSEAVDKHGGSKAAVPNEMTRTVDYWIMFLSRIRSRSHLKDFTV